MNRGVMSLFEHKGTLRLLFVRHGAAEETEGRCIGHTDARLSQAGAESIRELLLRHTTRVDRIVSSDLARAHESARILSEASGIPVHVDARLREMNFGAWDGRTWAELEQGDGARVSAWMDQWTTTAPPDGESIEMVAARVGAWMKDEFARMDTLDRTIVIVAHAGSIRIALCLLTGTPFSDMFNIVVEHAQVNMIELTDGRTTFTPAAAS